MMTTKLHPFEKAGLGKSPFRVVAFTVKRGPITTVSNGVTVSVGSPGQPMGSCHFCGTGIANVYVIESSDGVRSDVGCECVNKTSDVGLTTTVKKMKRDHDRTLRQKRKVAKREAQAVKSAADADAFIAEIDGLKEALETDHYIIRDIAAKLKYWGSISEKQIELIFKIADQKKQRDEQVFISVPIEDGRQTVVGKVVSAKWTMVGTSWNPVDVLKAMIIVDTPEGQWKTWGTIPASITDKFPIDTAANIKGSMVQFDAKLKLATNDNTMSFYSRPTKGKLLEVE
jgi:hypothetical protein